MEDDQIKQLKQMQAENDRLKKAARGPGAGQADHRGSAQGKRLSPTALREGVDRARRTLEVSERRACRAVGQPRSTQRYEATKAVTDRPLVEAIMDVVRRNPRFGYRRIHATVKREGFRVGRDRVHRLCRRHRLRVPKRVIKRRRLGSSENGIIRRRAEHIDHVWTYDFVSDQTADGRRLKMLTVEDEFTRECLAIEIGRGLHTISGVLGVDRE